MTLEAQKLQPDSLIRMYSRREEILHSLTHGIGVALSLVGLALLLRLAILYGDTYQVVSFSIYGASLLVLYVASTLYHSFERPAVKHALKIVDHAAIFFLIAGTYTPFLLLGVRGVWGWTLLGIIWGLAILGVTLKVLFIRRFQKQMVALYILMGWLSVLALRDLARVIPLGGLVWLAAGGVLYTVGVLFYVQKKTPYTHAIWHLFVLGGSICHYFAVLLYLVPLRS